jgi:hypothetical protein
MDGLKIYHATYPNTWQDDDFDDDDYHEKLSYRPELFCRPITRYFYNIL